MIRSELRWALGRRPAEEEGGASVQPVGQLQSLIAQKMQRAQELLEELRLQVTTRFSICQHGESRGRGPLPPFSMTNLIGKVD